MNLNICLTLWNVYKSPAHEYLGAVELKIKDFFFWKTKKNICILNSIFVFIKYFFHLDFKPMFLHQKRFTTRSNTSFSNKMNRGKYDKLTKDKIKKMRYFINCISFIYVTAAPTMPNISWIVPNISPLYLAFALFWEILNNH